MEELKLHGMRASFDEIAGNIRLDGIYHMHKTELFVWEMSAS